MKEREKWKGGKDEEVNGQVGKISCTLSVLSRRDIRVNLYLTPWATVAYHPYKLKCHILAMYYQCCPLPNSRNSNKMHHVQRVNKITIQPLQSTKYFNNQQQHYWQMSRRRQRSTGSKFNHLSRSICHHLAWPMWASSYTVGPQLYHRTLRPLCGMNGSYRHKLQNNSICKM